MTCKFEISGPHRLTCRAVRKLLQAFTRRHVPCAMCHQSTHGRHHRRSGVLARRMVLRRARSDQPFGRYSRKCLDTHTDWLTDWLTDRQTRPANYFSPTHQWKSTFIERSMLKHLNVHSLRFWITFMESAHHQPSNGICRFFWAFHDLPTNRDATVRLDADSPNNRNATVAPCGGRETFILDRLYTRSIMNVPRLPRGATVAFRLLGESAQRRPVAWDGLVCWAGPDRTADCWMNLDRRDPADPEKGRRGEKCAIGW